MKFVLDTSALLYIVERRLGLDELEGHEVYIPAAVLEELNALAKTKKKARLALKILESLKASICPEAGPADDAALKCAAALNAVLVTGDQELAERCKKAGLPVAKFHKKQLVIL